MRSDPKDSGNQDQRLLTHPLTSLASNLNPANLDKVQPVGVSPRPMSDQHLKIGDGDLPLPRPGADRAHDRGVRPALPAHRLRLAARPMWRPRWWRATASRAAAPDVVRRAAIGDGLPLMVIQLVGRTPEWISKGAKLAEEAGADIVDFNMGCPAKEVTGALSGSALMRELRTGGAPDRRGGQRHLASCHAQDAAGLGR